MKLIIGYLYGDLMNIYGDTGNIIALKKRAEWRGIEVKVRNISLKDKLKAKEVDLFFFGGGQDQSQGLVSKDLKGKGLPASRQGKGEVIKEEVERGVPLLSICGGYQLLGEYYQPLEGSKLEGVGLFPIYTVAGKERMIGNIVIKSSVLSSKSSDKKQKSLISKSEAVLTTDSFFVGFENHSGKTYLKEGGKSLGEVVTGFGNNGEDKTEGCIYKNAIGCYMHGSLLPKNPHLADWLIKKALEVKYGKPIELKQLDDEIELKAHEKAIQKFS